MTDKQRLLELALKGLETERARIQQEIAYIESQFRGFSGRQPRKAGPQGVALAATGGKRAATASRKRRRLSAAARKKLSDIAKRRWAASKKAGKTTL